MKNMPKSTSTATLSRRNSIGTPAVPTKLIITKLNLFRHHSSNYPKTAVVATPASSSSSSSSSPSFCYTSLKDVIPTSTVNSSPTTASSAIAAAHPGYEIAIRNRLVKQAAWTYLQPISAPDSDAGSFFRRIWVKFSTDLSKNSLVRIVIRAFGWFLQVIRVRNSE